ncbi:SPOR domain-containing protein [Rhizobiaceae bacterium BDR2-2]|uniref:SPOR domain-containing protein n=1 Tax=Ectorhizobium quercum TaxID=2965071 RepID=A0AAE3N0D1_9HYPH|nr:SPOR domain-containing protein [Ectorhizobium quercum]MCX8997561.1 SPOR domain-containing protein [Ectorhizobium quercum]
MAQEKYAYGSNPGDLFADDDPLAELARIVGYDQPSPRQSAAVPPAEPVSEPARPVASERPEPLFDLEDELLKEFERYDAPELDPVGSIAVDLPADDRRTGQADAAPVHVEPSFTGHFTENPVPLPSHSRPPVEEARAAIAGGFSAESKDDDAGEPSFDAEGDPSFDVDLADELELAVASDDPGLVEPVAERRPDVFRMPLANFQPARREPVVVEEAPVVEQVSEPEAPFVEQPEQAYDVEHFDTAEIKDAAPQPALDFAPEEVPAEPAEPVVAAAPERQEPELEDFDAAIADDEFELALDGLEIDLSDIVMSEVGVAEPVEPVAAKAPVEQPAVVVEEPAAVSAVPQSEEVAWSGDLPGFSEASADGDMPFDASQISDPDYGPEVVADLDVPDMPQHRADEPKAQPPVFDADFDAELAELIHDERPAVAAAVAKPAEAAQPARQSAPDLDDFSLMMNEDFSDPTSTPLDIERPTGRMVIDPDTMEVVDPEGSRRSRGWMVLAASVAILASATGLYAWWSNGGIGGLASGDGPPIVLADSEPVKVVPENPGGKTVPNQDKAVYDRVAGGGTLAPTQRSLISSSEEPLDVVQRTLSPENFPLQRAEDEEITEVQDDRLQPGDGSGSAAAEAPADSNVSLRKVRTMIVRPDGTLVAREVPETPAAPVAPAAQTQTAAALPASSSPSPVAPPPAGMPASVQGTATPAASDDALSQAADSTVAEPPAATAPPVQTAGDRAPVPVPRPAEQPVNVVGTVTNEGNVRPAANASAPATPAAPQEVASATTTQVPPGTYVVQIASLPSQAEAERSYSSMSSRYGSIIGGRDVDIRAADIPGRGTYYRVRVVAGSKADADTLCGRLKQAGGSCLVTR